MILMGDRGIPDGWRKMHGYYGHTLKLINKQGEWVYAQMHMKSKQGTAFITQEDSANYSPDYAQKDMYDAIAKCAFTVRNGGRVAISAQGVPCNGRWAKTLYQCKAQANLCAKK